jgi:hypothetical protein
MEIGVPFHIISRLSGLALTANCLNPISTLATKQVQPGYLPQIWTYTAAGTLDCGEDDLCLDIMYANRNAGGVLWLYQKTNGSSQKWELTKDGFVISKIALSMSTLVLDISTENTKFNANVITYSKNAPVCLNQLWDFIPASSVTKDYVTKLDSMYSKCRSLMYHNHMIAIEIDSKYDLANPSMYVKGGDHDFLNSIKGGSGSTPATILYFFENGDSIAGVLTFTMGNDKIHILVHMTSKGERKMNVGFNFTEKESEYYSKLEGNAKTEIKVNGKAKVSGFMSTGTKIYCKISIQ